jgi:Peptidase family M23
MANGMNYLAAWQPGSGAQYWVTGLNFNDFKTQDTAHFNTGMRLVSMRVQNGSFTAIWHPGSGAQHWVTGLSFNDFKAQDTAYFNAGLRLVDIEVQGANFSGVWRPGSGAQHWVTGLNFNDFKTQDTAYFNAGLRLVCLRSEPNGTFTAVWQPGTGAQYWQTGLSYADFKTTDTGHFNAGLRLVDIEIHNGLFTAVWRPGSGEQRWFFGDDFEMLAGRDEAYFEGTLRLRKIFPYGGSCNSSCLNQVVMPTGTYNYEITATVTHCNDLPGTDGTPAPGAVVTYHWPCLTNDGSKRLARISALTFGDAPFMTLPFKDHAVNELGTWLYDPGDWHHAIDFQRADKASFPVVAAAPGRVIFSGWDWWSGNTIIISHNSGDMQDAFRTIYMHLRNGPTHDADQCWNVTVGNLTGIAQTQYENYLTKTGCPKGGPYHPDPNFWGTDADAIDPHIVNKVVQAGDVIAHSGCTGPGGCGCTNTTAANWVWGGGVNTHLHLFTARRDPSDHKWYFVDPYGIYSSPGCYPGMNAAITTPCARYPILWKDGKAQYP